MDQEPLVTEETDAGAALVHQFDKCFPVKVAFWVKLSDEGQWYLYIASDHINDQNIGPAYGEVLRLADQMANAYFDPFRVKLIPTNDPLAEAAMEVHRRYPGRAATRLGGKLFGGLGVDGVYIYPASVTTIPP